MRAAALALFTILPACRAPDPAAGVSSAPETVSVPPAAPAPEFAKGPTPSPAPADPPSASPPPSPAPPIPPPAAPRPAPAPVPASPGTAAQLASLRARQKDELPAGAREIAAARTWLLEGKPLRAHEELKAVDPVSLPSEEARLSWRLAMAECFARLGDFERAHEALSAAERAVRPLAPIAVTGACFSSDARLRVPTEKPALPAGAMASVWIDVERLGAAPEGGRFARKVAFDLTLREPSGRAVHDFADWERVHGRLEELHHRPPSDASFRLALPLPRGVNLGEYVLLIEVADVSGEPVRRAAASLPLTVR